MDPGKYQEAAPGVGATDALEVGTVDNSATSAATGGSDRPTADAAPSGVLRRRVPRAPEERNLMCA